MSVLSEETLVEWCGGWSIVRETCTRLAGEGSSTMQFTDVPDGVELDVQFSTSSVSLGSLPRTATGPLPVRYSNSGAARFPRDATHGERLNSNAALNSKDAQKGAGIYERVALATLPETSAAQRKGEAQAPPPLLVNDDEDGQVAIPKAAAIHHAGTSAASARAGVAVGNLPAHGLQHDESFARKASARRSVAMRETDVRVFRPLMNTAMRVSR